MRRWMPVAALAVALFAPACAVDQGTTADGDRTLEVRRATETETRAEVRDESGDAARATDATQREAADEARDAEVWSAENSKKVRAEAQEELSDAKLRMKELEARTDAEAVEERRELAIRTEKLEQDLKEFGQATGEALAAAGRELQDELLDLRDFLARIDVDVNLRPDPNDPD